MKRSNKWDEVKKKNVLFKILCLTFYYPTYRTDVYNFL